MNRDRLITVNRWNKKLFTPDANIFDIGGIADLAQKDFQSNPWNYSQDYLYGGNGPDITEQYMNSKNSFGIAKKDNPFSKMNIKNTASMGIGVATEALGTPFEKYKRGVYDAADPLYHLAGGNESVVGNAVSDVGVGIFKNSAQTGNFAGMAIGGVVKGVGSLINGALGTSVNKEKLERTKRGTDYLNNYNPSASSFDDIQNIAAVGNVENAYNSGWFRPGWARRRNRKLRKDRAYATEHAYSAQENAIDNLANEQTSMGLRNYSAFGGPLASYVPYTSDGALQYDLMSNYLTYKNNQAKNNNASSNPTLFALGGDIQMHGSDFSTGLVNIDAGGSHSENPYGGVQMGVDSQGVPNLVEEDEVVYNDYVFSNRISVDDETKKKFHIGKKQDITYAALAKKLEKEISERPTDPISQAGFKVQMEILEEQQERQKQEMEAKKAKEAFDALSPEEKVAVLQQYGQQKQQEAAIQDAMAEQAVAETMNENYENNGNNMQSVALSEDSIPMGEPSVAVQQETAQPRIQAAGGNLFGKGSNLNKWKWGDEFKYLKNGVYDKDYLDFLNNILTWDMVKDFYNNEKNAPLFSRYDSVNNLDQNSMYQFNIDDVRKWASDGKPSDWHKAIAAIYEKYKQAKEADTTADFTMNESELEPKNAATPITRADAVNAVMQGNPINTSISVGTPTYIEDEEMRKIAGQVLTDPKMKDVLNNLQEKKSEDNNSNPKNDPLRYAGLLGPATGLMMMATGVGRPDYSRLDSALASLGSPALASASHVGNYLTYRPMDIWYEQNRMNANARATDRAIMNNASPIGTKMAGLLANAYNNQIASGNLYRQALEYNDAKRAQVEEFNRGTNQFNAQSNNQTSQFNANAINAYNQAKARLGMAAAQTRLEGDAGWYNSLYGNVNNLFKGMSDLGRENTDRNWLNWYIDKVGIPGLAKRARGGKLKKKKGLAC